jgi:acyltransferase
MTSQGRIQYLDIAKGIGIILMVMGHSTFGEGFQHYIHGFHMPLFFFISGLLYTFKPERGWLEVCKGKCRSILVPYIVFGLITWGIWALTRGGRVSGADLFIPLRHLIWINSTGLVISGEFWFLSAMFFASLLFDGLFRIFARASIRCSILAVLVLIGCLFRRTFDIQLPWSLLSGMVGAGFMGIAYLMKQKAKAGGFARRLFSLHWYEIAILTLVSGVLIFINDPVNMRRSVYGNVPLFWLNATVMSVVIINVSMKIENFSMHGVLAECRNWLTGVGRDSITYLCLNSLILHFGVGFYRKSFGDELGFCRAVVIFVLTMVIIYWLNRIMMETKLRVFLGRQPLKYK